MKISSLICLAVLTLPSAAWCQIDPGSELLLIRQQQQNQKQYTQVDLSTDAGRKVYLLEHEPTRFQGTDRDRTLQMAADALAAKNPSSKSTSSSGGSLYDSLKASNPSLTQDSLRTMSEADIRALFYNKFRQEGKSMGEARELAASASISVSK